MPFSASVERRFEASHQLRLPNGSLEALHSHVWVLTVTVTTASLDAMDCVIDFHELEKWVDEIICPWRGRNLNDLPPFDSEVNPSAERVAEAVGRALRLPDRVSIEQVAVTEAPGCRAVWRPSAVLLNEKPRVLC